MKLTEAMIEDYFKLFTTFSPLDLENDSHAVFQLAGEAARNLTVKYGSPLAYGMARNLVDYAVRRYESVHGSVA